MSKPSDKPTFAIVLQAVPWEGAPPIIRLRKFLKAALRSYGLKCTECREAPPTAEAPAAVVEGSEAIR